MEPLYVNPTSGRTYNLNTVLLYIRKVDRALISVNTSQSVWLDECKYRFCLCTLSVNLKYSLMLCDREMKIA